MVTLDGNSLTIEQISEVARDLAHVTIAKEAQKKIRASRNYLEKLLKQGRVIYGVNTGFGAQPPESARIYQLKLCGQ